MPTDRYTPLRTLANWILALYGVVVLAVLVLCFGIFQELSMLDRLADAGPAEEFEILEQAEQLESTQLVTQGALGVVAIIATILFFRWTYMACKNARATTTVKLDTEPGWAVGWYFVPIANLWKPYTSLKEIWDISDVNRRGGAIVGFWWAFHIVALVMYRVHSAMMSSTAPGDIDGLVFVDQFAILVNLLSIGNYVTNGLVVHQLTNLQQEKYESGGQVGVRQCGSCGEQLEGAVRECPVCGARVRSRSSVDFGGIGAAVEGRGSRDDFPRFGDGAI